MSIDGDRTVVVSSRTFDRYRRKFDAKAGDAAFRPGMRLLEKADTCLQGREPRSAGLPLSRLSLLAGFDPVE
jgi:hypothetical protein